ncbi:dimethylamine monooxygenase subunit DmmA family protein [Billgrantia endophytica]|uniref:Uncharacterized protein n=1 Tax=Billgrantia endophytica TaxID=2033802 RepID=A0A2N7TZR5_9GAMM|nr:dimethylamine monooxygenase subunit DmmA family protein [Halomonas endophytica]PMR73662.1 hypothetical protein C1H69_16560 [Halomonas endophytica]
MPYDPDSDDPAIKSRPVYHSPAHLPPANDYLCVIEPAAREILSTLLRQACYRRARIVMSSAGAGRETVPTVVDRDVWEELARRLDDALETVTVGCRLVVAGSEGFLWDVQTFALEKGFVDEEIVLYPVAGQGRRVFCVHCHTLAEPVYVSPVNCPNCQMALEVRDHFSRRLGAYIGVRIDAEVPSEIPPREVLS